MTLKTEIVDGRGSKRSAEVDTEHRLRVTAVIGRDYPDPVETGTSNSYRFLKGLLGTTGLSSGTTSMNVNGSVTEQIYYVQASTEYDTYITDVIVLIADGSVAHNKFGALAALTNGFDLDVVESGETTKIVNAAKTCGEILTEGAVMNPVGTGTDLCIISNYSGADDAFIGIIQIDETLPYGLRLGRGTLDRFQARIKDDLTLLSDMTVQIFGYKHYPTV